MFRTHKKLDKYVYGVTNKCVDGRYVIFLDYDDVPLEWVEEEIKYLQVEFDLGRFDIFQTGNGYHAYCYDKVSLRELVEILRSSSTDDAYLNVPLRRARKVWTLRLSEKKGKTPFWVSTIDAVSFREQSAPHALIISKLYNLVIPLIDSDEEKDFLTAHYHINEKG